MMRITVVLEYPSEDDVPRIGINTTDFGIGKVCAVQFSDALAELEQLHDSAAPQHESQWQDISTAPKDGTHISIKLTDGSVLQNVIPQSDGDYWWNGVSELFISELKVTHWTPLPQHPDTPEGK